MSLFLAAKGDIRCLISPKFVEDVNGEDEGTIQAVLFPAVFKRSSKEEDTDVSKNLRVAKVILHTDSHRLSVSLSASPRLCLGLEAMLEQATLKSRKDMVLNNRRGLLSQATIRSRNTKAWQTSPSFHPEQKRKETIK